MCKFFTETVSLAIIHMLRIIMNSCDEAMRELYLLVFCIFAIIIQSMIEAFTHFFLSFAWVNVFISILLK